MSLAPIVLNLGFGSQTTVLNFGLGSQTTDFIFSFQLLVVTRLNYYYVAALHIYTTLCLVVRLQYSTLGLVVRLQYSTLGLVVGL